MTINQRILGRTGFHVSEIGLGFEHLKRQRPEKITALVREAISNGVNYFDLVWSLPNALEGVADAVEGQSKQMYLALHLGSGHKDGVYKRSRKPHECRRHYDEALNLLHRDYADIVNVHYVKDLVTWKEVHEKGIIDLATQLKDTGRAHAVSISTHDTEVVKLAAKCGLFDAIMFQVSMASHQLAGRNETLKTCAEHGVGVIAIKPFAGGKLLQREKQVNIWKYQTGGIKVRLKVPTNITPVHCLAYVLDQPGVCTTVPGVSNPKELHDILAYAKATKKEKRYSELLRKMTDPQPHPVS